jgi:tRNA-specific 2-thiouridylase
VDAQKDQSYVLYTLGQADLARTLFPVGRYDKPAIRAIAHELNLGLADKPDSADICFVPDGDYKSFVGARIPQQSGVVRDETGAIVGEHAGVAGFTVGQRRGLGVAVGEKRFVTSIDPALNVITIGSEDQLYSSRCEVDRVNWIAQPPDRTLRCDVKIRYRSEASPALVSVVGGTRAEVAFDRPQRAITPGQAAVFYNGDEVLGGGVIERASE